MTADKRLLGRSGADWAAIYKGQPPDPEESGRLLCSLKGAVAAHFKYAYAADCHYPDSPRFGSYQSDPEIFMFIAEAVLEKIDGQQTQVDHGKTREAAEVLQNEAARLLRTIEGDQR